MICCTCGGSGGLYTKCRHCDVDGHCACKSKQFEDLKAFEETAFINDRPFHVLRGDGVGRDCKPRFAFHRGYRTEWKRDLILGRIRKSRPEELWLARDPDDRLRPDAKRTM